jgi:nitrogen fixation protein NifB
MKKEDLLKHPCFNPKAAQFFGRVHLPVASKCNIQCRFCVRKYDCLNESRPGVTSFLLEPDAVVPYLEKVLAEEPRLTVVGIAGPGDAFATPDITLDALRRVREKYPSLLLCVSSNGLNIISYIKQLAGLDVSHVTITVNAVDPKIGAKIYKWVNDGGTVLHGEEAAALLWKKQKEAIKKLKQNGIAVKINSILIPGINDTHMDAIAQEIKALGVDIMNCAPLIPAQGSELSDIQSPDIQTVRAIRKRLKKTLPQMCHCTQCRADAAGLLGKQVACACAEALL